MNDKDNQANNEKVSEAIIPCKMYAKYINNKMMDASVMYDDSINSSTRDKIRMTIDILKACPESGGIASIDILISMDEVYSTCVSFSNLTTLWVPFYYLYIDTLYRFDEHSRCIAMCSSLIDACHKIGESQPVLFAYEYASIASYSMLRLEDALLYGLLALMLALHLNIHEAVIRAYDRLAKVYFRSHETGRAAQFHQKVMDRAVEPPESNLRLLHVSRSSSLIKLLDLQTIANAFSSSPETETIPRVLVSHMSTSRTGLVFQSANCVNNGPTTKSNAYKCIDFGHQFSLRHSKYISHNLSSFISILSRYLK